jgi:tetratricopeptide (TPR) repeat protein
VNGYEKTKELLSNPATERQGIAALSREMQSREQSQAVAAAILLAQHLRTHGETGKAVTVIEPYGGFTPAKLQETVLPAYLERTRCLAADARIREAVKALDYAKEKTEGHQRARVFSAYADMHGISGEWRIAIEQFKAALSYGDTYYTRKKTKESVEVVLGPVVPGTDAWKKTHRPTIEARLRHALRQYDIQQYGEGFVDYRDVRTAHLDKKYPSAIAQYTNLITKHTGSVYAEAAQFYRAQCLAEAGEPQKSIQALEAFIKASPLGLYRGEALYETGRLLLEQGDVAKAERTFNQTLEWIGKVRTQAQDLKLYAIPQKAQKIAAAPEAAQTMSANYDLKPADITPSMVINRQTTPWYLTRLEWDTRYYLGFIAFYRGKHDDALAQFTKAFDMNQALQKKHKSTLDSFHRRLQIACRVKCLLAYPEELNAFRNEEKLRFMLADFHALWEKWEPAERVYREFANDPRSSKPVKACALRALGEAAQHQHRWPDAKPYFHKVVEQYGDTPSAQSAMLTLGLETSAPLEQRAERLRKAHQINPKSSDGERALYQLGVMYYAEKKPKESLEVFNRFLQRYPQSRFLEIVNMFIEKQQG